MEFCHLRQSIQPSLLRLILRCFADEEVMAKAILDDELWSLIQPLLPPPKPRRTRSPGRKPLDDRGYDHDKYRRPLHAAGIATKIARRGAPATGAMMPAPDTGGTGAASIRTMSYRADTAFTSSIHRPLNRRSAGLGFQAAIPVTNRTASSSAACQSDPTMRRTRAVSACRLTSAAVMILHFLMALITFSNDIHHRN